MLVSGYHGTTLSVADALCRGIPWRPSENEGDWLGFGSYFFQDGAERAMTWAKIRHSGTGEPIAVLKAEIDLTNCLDLLDLKDFKLLRSKFLEAKAALSLPPQNPLHVSGGRAHPPKDQTPLELMNKRDRFMFDYCVESLRGMREITTVRCPFLWGSAVFSESYAFSWSRVEIAVREPIKAIKSIRLVDAM